MNIISLLKTMTQLSGAVMSSNDTSILIIYKHVTLKGLDISTFNYLLYCFAANQLLNNCKETYFIESYSVKVENYIQDQIKSFQSKIKAKVMKLN